MNRHLPEKPTSTEEVGLRNEIRALKILRQARFPGISAIEFGGDLDDRFGWDIVVSYGALPWDIGIQVKSSQSRADKFAQEMTDGHRPSLPTGVIVVNDHRSDSEITEVLRLQLEFARETSMRVWRLDRRHLALSPSHWACLKEKPTVANYCDYYAWLVAMSVHKLPILGRVRSLYVLGARILRSVLLKLPCEGCGSTGKRLFLPREEEQPLFFADEKGINKAIRRGLVETKLELLAELRKYEQTCKACRRKCQTTAPGKHLF